MKAQTLEDYIKEKYGTQAEYSRQSGHPRQVVCRWVKQGRIVIGGKLYKLMGDA